MSVSAAYFQPEVLSKIARLELRARHVVEGFISGMHRSPYRGFSVEFAAHRPYTPGDDIRHLDWRVYGKADRYFIKEYEVETNMRVHILLDASESMAYPEHAGTARMTKWTYAGTIAASLTHMLVLQGDGVGLTLFDTDVRQQLPVSTNRALLHTVANAIEAERPAGKTGLKAPLRRLADRVPIRGMVILISDLLTDVDDVIHGLQRLRFNRHDVLVMHVLDHDELEFPFADRTLFEAMEETNVEILTDPQSLRSAYLASLQAYIHRLRTACLNNGVDYELISTNDRVDLTLTRFLADRMRRQRAKA